MKTTSIRHRALSARLVALLVTCSGAAVLAQTAGPGGADREWQYQVVRGDTLIGIAARHLLDPDDWLRLQQHNRIEDPRRLQPGQVVRIPYDWLRSGPAAGEVVFVQGEVSLRRVGSEIAEPARVGTVVRPSDLLRTGRQASATLRFADGSRLLIRPDSEVLVENLLLYGRSAILDTGLDLHRGGVAARVQPQRTRPPAFEIRTPAVSLGVRGTEFRVRTGGPSDTSIVEVLEGRVAAQPRDERLSGAVRIDAGQGTVAAPGQPVAPPRPLLPPPVVSAGLLLPALRLDWQPVDGATAYRAQIFADLQASKLLREAVFERPPAQWPQAPDLDEGSYLLRLRAIDAAGVEGVDREVPFRVARQPLQDLQAPQSRQPQQPQQLPPPRLELPRDGAVIGGEAVNLRWGLQPGMLRYRLQIAPAGNFAGALRDHVVVGNDTEVALPPGVHHWRVATLAVAEGAERNGPFGPAQAFELRPIPPLPELEPVQYSPRNLLLRWRPTAAGQGLQIQIARDPAFEQLVFDQRTWGAQMQIPRPASGRYHLRMRSWIGDASAGEFGPGRVLDIPMVPFWERG